MSKKSKSERKVEDVVEEDDVPVEDVENASDQSAETDGGVPPSSPKKRKREANVQNLEIDLSLPEPPNKKALRKAKKSKMSGKDQSVPSETSNGDAAEVKVSTGIVEHGEGDEEDQAAKQAKPAKAKSNHSIWIGNLPFSATKAILTDFLMRNTKPAIAKESITRVNVPAPANAKATKTTIKPMNKGFAYIDFSDEQAFMVAMALSETQLGGRNLLIKDAKSFEGRPTEHQKKQKSGTNKVVSRRIFVGNLGFDVTVEDLESLFGKCGTIEHVHMATFQDSGKCKGFAWVTFSTEDAASAAVKGVVIEEVKPEADENDQLVDGEKSKAKRKPKKRQWWCNQLHGREVRREYAEDSSVRYNKRFGKGRKEPESRTEPIEEVQNGEASVELQEAPRQRNKHPHGLNPGGPTDPKKRRGRHGETAEEVTERTQYRTGQVAESQGTKVTFD